MRYRAQDPVTGDYQFGAGLSNFYIDIPEAPAQAVKTRLLLIQGEYFLDITVGVPYQTQILGAHTKPTYDQAIRTAIADTEGVLSILDYFSEVVDRNLKITATIDTIYGQIELEEVL